MLKKIKFFINLKNYKLNINNNVDFFFYTFTTKKGKSETYFYICYKQNYLKLTYKKTVNKYSVKQF